MKLRDFINIALRPLGSILKRPGWGDAWRQDIPRLLPPDREWCIFDCGANEGQTLEEMHPLFTHSTFHSFEPFPSTFETLKSAWGSKSNVHLHQLALGNQNGTSTFFINDDSATNSLLSNAPQASESEQKQSSVTVEQQTLDCFTSERKIDRIDLLKMDCQGFELEILKGAEDLLSSGRIGVIYSEVLFTPLYTGQAYFEDLCAFLRHHDYQLLALYDGRRSAAGHLMWSNALFSRRNR